MRQAPVTSQGEESVRSLGLRVEGIGFGVLGFGYRAWGFGFGV